MSVSAIPLPASGQVHLWLASEPAPLAVDLQQRYSTWLSSDEQQRMQRFHFAVDQQRFLLARALVRSVLGTYLQQEPQSLRFVCNAHGKPELKREAAGLSLSFNLSHTQGLLALAVTQNADIGVDVEAVTRTVDMLALAERFFAPAETAQIKHCAADRQRDCFFGIWTLKEAYVKARGLGLQLGLDSFAFQLDAADALVFSTPETGMEPSAWSFLQLHHAEHFRVAVAVHTGGLTLADMTVRTVTF
ncbi:MAG: 4'-phosphopantetheinyl transferase superfamily protein [Pseudomonadota bacterium]